MKNGGGRMHGRVGMWKKLMKLGFLIKPIGNIESNPRPYKHIANLSPHRYGTTLNTPPHVWPIFKSNKWTTQQGDVEHV